MDKINKYIYGESYSIKPSKDLLKKAMEKFEADRKTLIRRHYTYVALYYIKTHTLFLIVRLQTGEYTYNASLDIIVLVLCVLVGFLLKYSHKPLVNFVIFVCMIFPNLVSYKYLTTVILPVGNYEKFNMGTYVIAFLIREIHSYMITTNQPIYYGMTCLFIYCVLVPWYWYDSNSESTYFYFVLLITSGIHLLFRHTNMQVLKRLYVRKFQTKERLKSQSDILGMVSTSPIYMVKIPDLDEIYHEGDIYSSIGTGPAKPHQLLQSKAKLIDRLREYQLTLLNGQSLDATDLTTDRVLRYLEKMKFTTKSKFNIQTKPNRFLSSANERKALDEIMKGSYIYEDACEIIFKTYRHILNHKLKFISPVLRIQSLEHRESGTKSISGLSPKEGLVFFDVEFSFISFDDCISLVIIISDFSENQMISELEMINKQKETSLVAVVNDMRVPMNAIKEYTASLKEMMITQEPELSTEFDVIDANCEHLSLLIHDIIDHGYFITSSFFLHQKN